MGRPKAAQSEEGDIIQTLSPHGAAANISITATSAVTPLPDGDVIRISASIDCYLEFGDNGAVADTNSMMFLSGTEVFKSPYSQTHVAVIALAAETGVLSIIGMGND